MCGKNRTKAYARIRGGDLYPDLHGVVFFDDVKGGTEVSVEVWGLPPYKPAEDNKQPIGPFGFHIHENGLCQITDPNNPFESAGGHYNPTNQPHGSVYSLEKLVDEKTIVTNHVVNNRDGQV
ncbi:superoxide dismutase family protein [Tissierella praeacuta]|uniref:superoxide dismutase family protein n=1 Tax=Tissierella praeacuta TaxID=43131 RepID=UPI00333E8465